MGIWQKYRDTTPRFLPDTAVRDVIPDIDVWIIQCGGELAYYLTELFAGDGAFRSDLHEVGRAFYDGCLLYPAALSDTQPVCRAFTHIRKRYASREVTISFCNGMDGFVSCLGRVVAKTKEKFLHGFYAELYLRKRNVFSHCG